MATSYNNLAGLLQAQGKHEEAEPLHRRALKIFEEILGYDHPHTKTVRNNLNLLLEQVNKEADRR